MPRSVARIAAMVGLERDCQSRAVRLKAMTTQVLGSELRAGDTIEVWWAPQRDMIIELRPYAGPLAHLFPKGAQIASFALLKSGLTIDNEDVFVRVEPEISEPRERSA